MNWFGQPWPDSKNRASICADDSRKIKTPVGESCAFCEMVIEKTDRGEQLSSGDYVHAECALRDVMGNHIHVRGECSYRGECVKLSTLTYREEALEVWRILKYDTDLGA